MKALEVAQHYLGAAQKKMKGYYDQKAKYCSFAPGEEVLVLLPLQGQPLAARYCGPYMIEKKVGDLDYLVATPDRRKRAQLCHVNMLKSYFRRKNQEGCFSSAKKEASLVLFSFRAEEATEVLGSELGVPAEDWGKYGVLLGERLQHLGEMQKKEFDCQSEVATTGVKPMGKREGSVYFNWGSDRDQIEEQLNAPPKEHFDTSAEIPQKAPEECATLAGEDEVHHGSKKFLHPIVFHFADSSGRGRGRGRGKGVLVERAAGRFLSRTVLGRWPVLWLIG